MQPQEGRLGAETLQDMGLVVHDLHGEDQLEQCVTLQRATWGDDFRELVPPAMLMIAQKIGGVLLGACDNEKALVGFVFGLTGIIDGRPVHWSHMMAVDERWRDRGLGRALKHLQQHRLLDQGIDRALWTYDPLAARNAHLNINRLGARILDYVPNMYGENPLSRADSAIGSDRFVVEWDLRATQTSSLTPSADTPAVTLTHGEDGDVLLPEAPTVLVHIPHDIQILKQEDPSCALAWRRITRRALTHYLPAGYRVIGFQRGSTSSAYVLGITEPNHA
jgi:predicted GNAT superfamily acetyltransferase